MHVSALAIHPVKSTASVARSETFVHRWGLADDRRWMVVDPEGTTITARTNRRMLRISAQPLGGGIRLTAPGLPALDVAEPHGPATRQLSMPRVVSGVPAGRSAAEWLTRHLDEPVTLVWLDDPGRRPVSVNHGGQPGDMLAFADAGPILLTSTASLARLNEWIAQTARARRETPPSDLLPMVRFRPNIVVDGLEEPFIEDGWARVFIGDVELRFGEHCDRCVLTTIDPGSLRSAKEPLRTLALHRQWDHLVHFGIRLIPETSGLIRVGDEVTVRTAAMQDRATVG